MFKRTFVAVAIGSILFTNAAAETIQPQEVTSDQKSTIEKVKAKQTPASHTGSEENKEKQIEEKSKKQSADNLEVIVISATRTDKALKDVVGSVSVITAENIEQQAITDMNQLFKYEPGVSITGRAGGAQNIQVRGMGGDRVLMIKDGMRMNEGYGANGLNDIVGRGFVETDTLKQVEIAKGAASSLYGADALGGIVVFTTKDASDYLKDGEPFGGRIKLGYTDLSKQSNQAATLALQQGNAGHLLNVSLRQGHEEENYAGSANPFSIDSQSFLYKLNYQLTEQDSMSFLADYWQQKVDGDRAAGLLGYFYGLSEYGYHIVDESNENKKTTRSLKLNYHSTAKRSWHDELNLSLYTNLSRQTDIEYGKLDINSPMFGIIEMRDMWQTALYEQKTIGFLSNASKQLNSIHTLGFGIDIEQTDSTRPVYEYRTADGEVIMDNMTDKFPKNKTSRYGLFMNDEMSFNRGRLLVTPGARFDHYKMDPGGAKKTTGESFSVIDKSHLSFNLGARYSLTNRLNMYAQYGQGFKVPAYDLAYIEHYLQPTSTYIYEIVPSDDLAPEESDTFEIGVRGHIGPMIVNAALYHSKYSNFLETALLESEDVYNDAGEFLHNYQKFQYQNLDSVTIKGAELSLSWDIGDFTSLYAKASYQDGKNNETGDYLRSINPISGVLGVRYSADKFDSDLVLNWARTMTKTNEEETTGAGYGVVDWLVNYQATYAIRFTLAMHNILDKEYARYSTIAGLSKNTNLSPYTEAGRNFSATVSYQF